jgi:hypothetical protein
MCLKLLDCIIRLIKCYEKLSNKTVCCSNYADKFIPTFHIAYA